MPADLLRSLPNTKVGFIESMDCLPVPKLPDGSQWIWEILCGVEIFVAQSTETVVLRGFCDQVQHIIQLDLG